MARVYLSSTYEDLSDARSIVYTTLRRLGHDVIAMEDYVATDQRPLDKCVTDVANADIYVGVIAWRYGYIPPDCNQSITELEFRKAVETGRNCLLFLLSEEAPWPRKFIDRDLQRIDTFRAELARDYIISNFGSADELATLVSIAVTRSDANRSTIVQKSSSASQIVSEAMTMTFVDLMRLLHVASSKVAFQYNVDRYGEFVGIATDHLDDLKGQLQGFSTLLDSESIGICERIKRQLVWVFGPLRSQPTQPMGNSEIYRKMQATSIDIHNFCLQSGYKRYQAEWNIVKEMVETTYAIDLMRARMEIETLLQLRMSMQSEVLNKHQSTKEPLYGIVYDAAYDLSFLYFAIDYHLLPHLIR